MDEQQLTDLTDSRVTAEHLCDSFIRELGASGCLPCRDVVVSAARRF